MEILKPVETPNGYAIDLDRLVSLLAVIYDLDPTEKEILAGICTDATQMGDRDVTVASIRLLDHVLALRGIKQNSSDY